MDQPSVTISVADLGFRKGGSAVQNVFDSARAHEAGDPCAQNDKKGGFHGTQGTPLDPPLHLRPTSISHVCIYHESNYCGYNIP